MHSSVEIGCPVPNQDLPQQGPKRRKRKHLKEQAADTPGTQVSGPATPFPEAGPSTSPSQSWGEHPRAATGLLLCCALP